MRLPESPFEYTCDRWSERFWLLDKFMPPNSNIPMHQPDEKTAENTLPPSPPSLPIEKLLESMKPEKPLIIESGAGAFGQGGGMINSSSAGGASSTSTGAPQQ